MRNFVNFSAGVQACFENEQNLNDFKGLLMSASHRDYSKYSKEDTKNMINNGFDKLFGFDYKSADKKTRRQGLRKHGMEIAELIEDVLVDRMVSGWNEDNAFFNNYVERVNLADGNKAEWYVEDNSLLVVSKFAGNHHSLIRQAIKPGKAFTVDTSDYGLKVYADFEAMRLGNIDFATLVDRMYTSIEKNRLAAVYEAFMGMDEVLPTDMILETQMTEAAKDKIVDKIELVKSVTGKDVVLVGSRVAIQKLQGTVSYNMFSNGMKDERYQNGILANWEGYECMPLSRVNAQGTRTTMLDNSKIYIMPVDPDFKPIKDVFEGDVTYYEFGMDGSKKDMTAEAEIAYKEGFGVVVSLLFGEIKITA